MNNETSLPTGYTAYDRLTFCSNVLIGGGVPVRVKGQFPVLVGRGPEVPFIWLSRTKDGKDWEPVVEQNEPRDPNFTINILGDHQTVQIVLGNFVVVQARQVSAAEAEVTILDLRPLGVNIQGSANGLRVGTQTLTGNVFQGVTGMIDIA